MERGESRQGARLRHGPSTTPRRAAGGVWSRRSSSRLRCGLGHFATTPKSAVARILENPGNKVCRKRGYGSYNFERL
jgi:hypothetical protein